jgi:hypothetical protein
MFNICGAFSGIPLLCPLNSFKEWNMTDSLIAYRCKKI